jgi:putative nucleotidyltransferase with HDIG domain
VKTIGRPPRLLVKTTIAVTLVTVVLLLVVVFVVTLTVREQVRQAVTDNLESSQRLFGAIERRRQSELRAQAATVADSPTLKAALDTYALYATTSNDATKVQLFATIANELDKVGERIEADAIVLADAHQNTLAATGRLADRWQRGRAVNVIASEGDAADAGTYDGVVHLDGHTFRVVTVPLLLNTDTLIGTLYVASSLDRAYANSLESLSRTQIAIVSQGRTIASTLEPGTVAEFEAGVGRMNVNDGIMDLRGESYAYRRLFQIGDSSFYALASIDDASRPALRSGMRNLGLIAAGGTLLALVGSFWLARQLTEPIGRLSRSLERMAVARQIEGALPLTGSSRELDTLTETFNAMMASVVAAEAQTEAAYTGAIRALAAALDARDPYTAGHSERVSVISVAIGRVLELPADDLEVIRLGALLHDIGKIGVPDQVLRKPGSLTPSEYDAIKEHPVLGARILRPVPFLARHLPIVELHHERPDGRGYPHGLRDQDIPLAARIVHVADAYDAMTSARAYRGARPAGEALRELWRCSGTEFHAEIVGALATALPGVTSEGAARVLETVGG